MRVMDLPDAELYCCGQPMTVRTAKQGMDTLYADDGMAVQVSVIERSLACELCSGVLSMASSQPLPVVTR